MYSWRDVARRTEVVYTKVLQRPARPLLHRIRKMNQCGPFSGKCFLVMVIIDYIVWRILEWLQPRREIDLAPEYKYEQPPDPCPLAVLEMGTDSQQVRSVSEESQMTSNATEFLHRAEVHCGDEVKHVFGTDGDDKSTIDSKKGSIKLTREQLLSEEDGGGVHDNRSDRSKDSSSSEKDSSVSSDDTVRQRKINNKSECIVKRNSPHRPNTNSKIIKKETLVTI
eukprot:Platyproteum_vivax@DN14214_c0_g1_i1.p1